MIRSIEDDGIAQAVRERFDKLAETGPSDRGARRFLYRDTTSERYYLLHVDPHNADHVQAGGPDDVPALVSQLSPYEVTWHEEHVAWMTAAAAQPS